MKRKERYIARLDEVKITREGDYAFIDYTTPGSKCEGLFAFRPRPDHRADSGHSKRSRSRLRQNDAEHLAKRARIEPWTAVEAVRCNLRAVRTNHADKCL